MSICCVKFHLKIYKNNVMKIVKVEPDESVVKRIICSNCGVTLEYVPNDKYGKTYSCCGHIEHDYFITCINCKQELMVH